ncbi:MAG: thymidylate synthase [Gammaproteobacteria bacterium]|nr:thymidylate synthase [Gammaproteobacteria bacterium]
MAYLFKGRNEKSFENSFFKALQKIYYSGNIVAPRGQETLELEHAVLEVDPLKSLIISPLRKMNWFFLLAENMYYWSGRNSTELVSHYMKGYRKFSDNNLHQGAYSPQLLEQIRHVVNSLKNDPDSRQAVITLWRPNPQQAKDIPCTISFDFKIRNNKLNMHSTMRSNDIIWGSCYDIPSFSMIQIVIAGILGIETGTLYLTAHSLHL